MNLLMLLLCFSRDKFRALFHLLLAALNLLPLRPMDGGNALWLLLDWGFGPTVAERFCSRLERAGALLLLLLGLWLLLRQRNPSLLVFALLMTWQGREG